MTCIISAYLIRRSNIFIITHMNIKTYLIFIFMVGLSLQANVHTGTILKGAGVAPSKVQSYPYTLLTSANTVCKIQLSQTTFPRQSILMIVRRTATTITASKSLYFSQDYSTDRDLENANQGETQMVELRGLTSLQTIYIYLIFFDQNSDVGISLTATQSNTNSNDCTQALSGSSSSIFCGATCPPSIFPNTKIIGSFCGTDEHTLLNGQNMLTTVNAGQFKVFALPIEGNKITLAFVSNQNNLEAFVQVKSYDNQMAGLVNYFTSPFISTRYKTVASVANTITINSNGKEVSISILNQLTSSATFTIQYTTASTEASTNLLIIILAVLGGVLFISLVIAGFFLIKRMNNNQNMVNPRISSSNMIQIQQVQNNLSSIEIEMYFPSVNASAVLGSNLQSSTMAINQSNKNNIDRDCVICLCPVEGNDSMKVTYCRHLFHSHCLTQWFKKQRNCPYCRQQYSKSSTLEHYQQILKHSGRNMLGGRDLVDQILKHKPNKSKVLIQDIKD